MPSIRTDDIQVPSSGWLEVPLLLDGTYVSIIGCRSGAVNYKLGSAGISDGTLLDTNNTVVFSPTSIYVHSTMLVNTPTITVVRDYV